MFFDIPQFNEIRKPFEMNENENNIKIYMMQEKQCLERKNAYIWEDRSQISNLNLNIQKKNSNMKKAKKQGKKQTTKIRAENERKQKNSEKPMNPKLVLSIDQH